MAANKPPYVGIDGSYYEFEFLEAVVAQLEFKARMVKLGIDTSTEIDQFAYTVLKNSIFGGRLREVSING
jgi:hypothetical protein